MAVNKSISQPTSQRAYLTEAELWLAVVTEEEVWRGVLSQPDARDHALCFQRVLTDINYSHNKVNRFVDMKDGKWQDDGHSWNGEDNS